MNDEILVQYHIDWWLWF